MKMEQIFREFERALENEYYMELAKKEVMTVPLLIEVFLTMIMPILCGRNSFLNV